MAWTRWGWLAGGVVLAPVLLVVGGLTTTSGSAPLAAAPVAAVPPVGAAEAAGDAGALVVALQQRLERLPGDYGSWAALGQAYLAQARNSADPSYYERAAGAFDRSLEVRPDDNADALAGQAALANARHEFVTGRDTALRAVALDPYDAAAKGVLSDAYVQLGAYEDARVAMQEMADLRPGVPALTRVAYLAELRGDVTDASALLDRALGMAGSEVEAGYILGLSGRLALESGDYPGALAYFGAGLGRDADSAELLAGRGAANAALGDVEAALADYDAAVQRLPQPTYVVAYAELLDSTAEPERAAGQYAVAEAQRVLFDAAGVTPDIEVALFEADHGDPDRAVAIAAGHAAQRADSVVVADAMAWALHAAGRDAEALVHAAAAQRIGTRNALWDYHRGMIQLELGMTAEAAASLEQALALSPEFSPLHAPLARAALDDLRAA